VLTVIDCPKIAGANSPIFKIVGAKAPIAPVLNVPLNCDIYSDILQSFDLRTLSFLEKNLLTVVIGIELTCF
jgi:hypothetical protein